MNIKKNQDKQSNLLSNANDTVKILSDITRTDLERSYNLDTVVEKTAYFSKRYGWTIRKISS